MRRALGLIGVLVMAYAVYGLLTDDGVRQVGVLAFLVGLVVAHDLVLLPLAVGIGAVLARFAPAWSRPPLYYGLFASAIVTAIAFPFLVQDRPALNYERGLLIVLAVIWAAALSGVLVRRGRRARR